MKIYPLWTKLFAMTTTLLVINLTSPAVASAQKKIVTFNSFHSDAASRKAMEKVVELFEKKYPNIRVDMSTTAHEDFKTAIRMWLTAATPPDVVTWFAGERARFFVKSSLTMDITDMWQGKEYDNIFPKAFRSLCVFDGKASFIPQSWYWWGVWYRKLMFAKYGLMPPKTWDEFLKLCEKLKGQGVTPIAIGTKYRWTAAGWFDYFNLRINGHDFHMGLMAGEESYTDPRLYKVFETWKELVEKGYFLENAAAYSWQEAIPFMVEEKAAMYHMGKFITDAVPKAIQDDFDFFQFPIIDPSVPMVEEIPLDGFMASIKAPHPDEAKIFLDFQASKEAQELFNLELGRIAANIQIPIEVYPPIVQKGIEMIKEADSATQFYDRDTTPPMADKGLSAFVEFMMYPENYKQILARLDEVRRDIFKK